MKAFMDASAAVYFTKQWKDKLGAAFTVKKKEVPNACAVRMSAPRFMGLDISSAPTPKYPRIIPLPREGGRVG